MSGLPIVLALSAAAMLLVALLALWQSLRAAFGAVDPSGTRWASESASAERQALLDEKESLLADIKDLEFEHQVGKISDTDFERLDRSLRARAKEVLRLLDEDLGPYRDRAEALVKEYLEKALGAVPYREKNEPAAEATSACPECGTANDPDAKFCKECAHRLEPESPDQDAEERNETSSTESEDEQDEQEEKEERE